MKPTKYKGILYFIIAAITLTLCLQAYWFYRSFKAEQKELISDVQVSLNKAVDDYFTQLAQKQSMLFASDTLTVSIDNPSFNFPDRWEFIDSISGGTIQHFELTDSLNGSSFTAVSIIDSVANERPQLKNKGHPTQFFWSFGQTPL